MTDGDAKLNRDMWKFLEKHPTVGTIALVLDDGTLFVNAKNGDAWLQWAKIRGAGK